METNKKITEEQIIETVDKVATQHIEKNLCNFLTNNLERLVEDETTKHYSKELAAMSTAIQISTLILKEALIELLCEE